jgi:CheY-like chemotaxis protein
MATAGSEHVRLGHFIDGQDVAGAGGRAGEVFDPATGAVAATVALASTAEVAAAVDAAQRAFPAWAATTPLNRARILFKFKELLARDADAIAAAITREHGKLPSDARGELTRGMEVVEFACGIPHLLKGEHSMNVGGGVDSWSEYAPLGVVAGITPFNFPCMVPMWMFPVALACGNTFILKPSERDPTAPLLLAKLLADNPDGNLSEKQVEFARTIYEAGSDLLDLINDILDLSKVEAGKMDVELEEVPLTDFAERSRQAFEPVTDEQGLELKIEVDPSAGEAVTTDGRRVQQVLKNLLSNACKFTEDGTISLRIAKASDDVRYMSEHLREMDDIIAFEVTDTGIGIPADKLRLIFEAFQQAEGGISRRYGGTGLGLSISREIARLLGGEIHVRSEQGEGSTFTLYLPRTWSPAQDAELDVIPLGGGATSAVPSGTAATSEAVVAFSRSSSSGVHVIEAPEVTREQVERNELGDDRDDIQPGDRVVLVVEDDQTFAGELMSTARGQDYKVIATTRGDVGWALAHEYRPDAIVLDIRLPGASGWSVLDRLKHHPATRHIPVHVVSAFDERNHALRAGAAAFVNKPLTHDQMEEAFAVVTESLDDGVRRVLVVEDDKTERDSIVELIASGDDVEATAVASAETAWKQLHKDGARFDCMVLDLKLKKQSGFKLLERIRSDEALRELPIIVYTGRELTREEDRQLRDLSASIIVKDARSPERLLDETTLFLHRVESRMPAEKRRMLEQLHASDQVFKDKRVLVVDDDVRNVFALTSLLEGHGMSVAYAENGREGIEALEREQFDLVLMDVMMPEMDGYETTQAIRERDEWRGLPIIALTAKAMKGDRERSIASGASDYITKPVDAEQLLSLMRVWLSA